MRTNKDQDTIYDTPLVSDNDALASPAVPFPPYRDDGPSTPSASGGTYLSYRSELDTAGAGPTPVRETSKVNPGKTYADAAFNGPTETNMGESYADAVFNEPPKTSSAPADISSARNRSHNTKKDKGKAPASPAAASHPSPPLDRLRHTAERFEHEVASATSSGLATARRKSQEMAHSMRSAMTGVDVSPNDALNDLSRARTKPWTEQPLVLALAWVAVVGAVYYGWVVLGLGRDIVG